MNKKLLTSLICASSTFTFSTVAQADVLGFRVGGYAWQQEFDGDVQSGDNGDVISIDDTLGYDDETNNSFYVALEHPVPFIPNIMLSRTEIDVSAVQSASFEFDGIEFDGSIDSSADLSHTDATFYYEVLDNWVSLDVGITARSFDEGFEITGETDFGTDSSELDVDEVIPMLYLATKFELPLSGLYIIADGNWISYDDDTLMDYKIGLGYETDIGFGIEAGMRSFEVEYEEEDDEEFADITIDGVYAGVFYHF